MKQLNNGRTCKRCWTKAWTWIKEQTSIQKKYIKTKWPGSPISINIISTLAYLANFKWSLSIWARMHFATLIAFSISLSKWISWLELTIIRRWWCITKRIKSCMCLIGIILRISIKIECLVITNKRIVRKLKSQKYFKRSNWCKVKKRALARRLRAGILVFP